MTPGLRVVLTTPLASGAVAVVDLHGDVTRFLAAVTDVASWPVGGSRLVRFHDEQGVFDEGLAVRLDETHAQLMPHGGVRGVTRLIQWLVRCGAEVEEAPDPQQLYPEAADAVEAYMLAALAQAVSPLAIDALLAQPRLWRERLRGCGGDSPASWDRLIHPPTVVVMGRPNVGKSTLTNRVMGRRVSLTADLPGTTRDWVGSLAVLEGLAVHWLDTPGLRPSDDPIEQEAIRRAGEVIERADLLLAMRDPMSDYPPLPREPELRVVNKIDLSRDALMPGEAGEMGVSSATGEGVEALVRRVRDLLLPDGVPTDRAWAFCDALRGRLG